MRLLVVSLLLAVGVGAAQAAVSSPRPPRPVAGFHTPRIECIVWDSIGEFDCHVTGRTRIVTMAADGRAESRPNAALASLRAEYGRLLRVGRTWRFQEFRCRRSPSTLTCRNASNHGWVIDRRGIARLF